jgi:RimJ/RimL family protein N-acetyltransferase
MFARTDRLLLRPGWPEDAEALFQAVCDEGIVRNLASAPWPYRMSDAKAFLATERNALEPSFLVLRRTDAASELVGTVGFGRRPDGELEFGYWMSRRHWGLGYATEAGRAALGAARILGIKKLHAGHFADNPASGRVLAKLGFRSTGQVAARYSCGRAEAAPCKLFELDLADEDPAASEDGPVQMLAA